MYIYRHDIAEILLKVALNTISINQSNVYNYYEEDHEWR